MTNDEMKKYAAALGFAAEKHFGQFRIGGLPYIIHPIAVSEAVTAKGYGFDYAVTALFHDLLEDTDATEEEILSFGNERILKAVKLLTKTRGYVMEEYVAGIKSDEIAFAVKSADRLHNLLSATCANDDFKRRYILESEIWYPDFDTEIPKAIKALKDSIKK